LNINECIDNRPSMDEEFFTDVIKWAKRSMDPSSQVGCVIVTPDNAVVSTGYNGPVRGANLKDPWLQEMLQKRPEKYWFMEHGERNAIFNASRQGKSLVGCTLYILGMPCTDCCRAICQTGIAKVKILKETNDLWAKHPSWEPGVKAAMYMFAASGVEVEFCDVKIMVPMSIRFNGQNYLVGNRDAEALPETVQKA
jgi:dCMP deaminase